MDFPKKLQDKLLARKENNSFRVLPTVKNIVDFSSNDYLGFANSEIIYKQAHQFLIENNLKKNGATGSRLLSGNNKLFEEVERFLGDFHNSETASIFNSGYAANLGFFGTFPQRGDVILYDELIHASIRDGMQLSNAKSFKFKHNDLNSLEEMLNRVQHNNSALYVVTESVFSMDGDAPDLVAMAESCKKHNAFFVVDEAHAVGVFGGGLVQKNNLQDAVFARIVTFGKAMGCHGAAILGSSELKEYVVNFARSFIYTTALSPHSLATIRFAYNELLNVSLSDTDENPHCIENAQKRLKATIQHFKQEVKRLDLDFIHSESAIHCCIISGNSNVKEISNQLQQKGFNVKAVLFPTVPEGKERLRFCLHSYNTEQDITSVLETLHLLLNKKVL